MNPILPPKRSLATILAGRKAAAQARIQAEAEIEASIPLPAPVTEVVAEAPMNPTTPTNPVVVGKLSLAQDDTRNALQIIECPS